MAKRTKYCSLLVGAMMVMSSSAFSAEPQTEPEPLTSEQQMQLVIEGQKLAKKRCASCHSIKREGDSLKKGAPPFRTFASKWPLESLEESLAEGIVTGHAEMPEAVFTPQEITAFLEFLGSLQKK